MKNSIGVLLLLISSMQIFSQEKTKEEKFGILVYAKFGTAKLIQSGNVDLNGNVNSGDVQLYYKLPSGLYFSTGIGLLEFNANGVSVGESYALEQSYLKIPFFINRSTSIFGGQLDNKLSFFGGAGIYVNTLLKEKAQTVNETFSQKNQGWNAGLGFNFGVQFEIFEHSSFGIGFDTQSDLTKMKKSGVDRKLEGINTVNFTFKWEL